MPIRRRLAERVRRHVPRPLPGGAPQRDPYLALAELHRRRLTPASTPVIADLTTYELRVLSQNGEDGVLAEMTRRLGIASGTFVEFGGGNGHEATCICLADVFGWSGFLVEGDAARFASLERKYRFRPDVRTHHGMVTADGVEDLFRSLGVPAEPDVLSIDIDGPDYWVWRAIQSYRPAIVVIEYNAALGPDARLVQPHDAPVAASRLARFGASIGALIELGREKGYRLVHLELAGVNAFFVREDLDGDWPERVLHRAPNYDLRGRHHPDGEAPPWEYVDVS